LAAEAAWMRWNSVLLRDWRARAISCVARVSPRFARARARDENRHPLAYPARVLVGIRCLGHAQLGLDLVQLLLCAHCELLLPRRRLALALELRRCLAELSVEVARALAERVDLREQCCADLGYLRRVRRRLTGCGRDARLVVAHVGHEALQDVAVLGALLRHLGHLPPQLVHLLVEQAPQLDLALHLARGAQLGDLGLGVRQRALRLLKLRANLARLDLAHLRKACVCVCV
jgi:hypothetical protein